MNTKLVSPLLIVAGLACLLLGFADHYVPIIWEALRASLFWLLPQARGGLG